LAHIATATTALETASCAETLLILGVALHDGEALAADGERAGGHGGLERLWASEVDEGAILQYS
jgi:hypothetical protein